MRFFVLFRKVKKKKISKQINTKFRKFQKSQEMNKHMDLFSKNDVVRRGIRLNHSLIDRKKEAFCLHYKDDKRTCIAILLLVYVQHVLTDEGALCRDNKVEA